LKKKEQVILLLNRRGFSSFIKCKDCGYIENCDNCNITLTYHLRGHLLRCHYCNFLKKAPRICPECHGADILFRGLGTQRVEDALKRQWPQARVVRMDLDTTIQKWSHDRILQDFGQGKYDILLGTQMIAKGLDFYRVTLVGVINADVGLLIPDFRSSEKTFQLLTQVAGRAGRKHLPGEVIIQTYSPNSHCLLCAQNHDFKRFFYGEISERKELFYPPYGRLISVLFRGTDEKKVRQAALNYAEVIKAMQGLFKVLGPTPSPIARIQKKYRWQIILKGNKNKDPGGKTMRAAIRKSELLYKNDCKVRNVQIAVDVDPVMLI
ncbi:MAG: primosomal protein N', partial [bacterium]